MICRKDAEMEGERGLEVGHTMSATTRGCASYSGPVAGPARPITIEREERVMEY